MNLEIGMKFSRLNVVSVKKTHCGQGRARCICICGKEKFVAVSHLLAGRVRSCGCSKNIKPAKCKICSIDDPNKFYGKEKNLCKTCKIKLGTEREKLDIDIGLKRRQWALRFQQKSAKNFLTRQICNAKTRSKENGLKFEIDIKYVLDLWDKQAGRCAFSGLKMVHEYNSLRTVSMDRIDSNVGYAQGNIQLVCKALNFAKNQSSNDEFLKFMNDLIDALLSKRKEERL